MSDQETIEARHCKPVFGGRVGIRNPSSDSYCIYSPLPHVPTTIVHTARCVKVSMWETRGGGEGKGEMIVGIPGEEGCDNRTQKQHGHTTMTTAP